jgi:hypothetical protein
VAAESLSKLLGLAVSLAVALLALWWLTRHEWRRSPRAFLRGYPARDFPRRARLDGTLARLCASQAALLDLLQSLPPADPARATLLVFLEELRALMDGAYDLAALQTSAATRARLDRLAEDVEAAAREMINSTERHVADPITHGMGELEIRVEVLQALARDADL